MKEQTNIHTQTIINKTWNSSEGAFEFSFTFAFRNKEQYLTFRQLWRDNYAALSVALRGRKQLIKSTMRKCEYAGTLQIEVHELKKEATTQLLMLKAAKREAHRQFLAARQVTP